MTKRAFSPLVRKPDTLITASLEVIAYLTKRARLDEIEQYEALIGEEYNHEVAACHFHEAGPFRVAVMGKDGAPSCAGGFRMIVPGVYQSWMVGTETGWANDWREIHRATRWLMTQMIEARVARRFQTNALASRTEACAWYERLGLVYEGTAVGFGQNGEDMAQYGLSVPQNQKGKDDGRE